MAYGTESIPAVYKIFGPGNSYVTSAKMLVQLDGISIDMPAGPSELLIIADETADPAFIAADLLSQAEHGPDSQVILVTNSTELAKQVRSNTRQQLSSLNRKRIAAKALDHSRIIVVKNTADAIELSNLYAPEHLIIMTADAVSVADKVSSAGSVFIGQWSPESAGDYASGTNHTLPTNGYAAMYSGVSVDSFMKTTSYQQISKEGLEKLGPTIMTLAAAENLDAHKEAVAIRLNKK
jgi:histidinol dehydrogenase